MTAKEVNTVARSDHHSVNDTLDVQVVCADVGIADAHTITRSVPVHADIFDTDVLRVRDDDPAGLSRLVYEYVLQLDRVGRVNVDRFGCWRIVHHDCQTSDSIAKAKSSLVILAEN